MGFGLPGTGPAGQEKIHLPAAEEAAVQQEFLHNLRHMPAVGRADNDERIFGSKRILGVVWVQLSLPDQPVHRNQFIFQLLRQVLGYVPAVSGTGKI